ncbi:MAG TPA: inorganic phosphate transporter [Candidatus Poseidoniia archaeon]|jgi:PiT family inorganic phosphate transporter|nr:inorganic phosphate transporter [Candidatus Poseidoniia archaeon]
MFGLDLMIFLAIVIAGYMAWNIGANDVANAMGTSVGSKALTLRNAIIIAAVFEFLGAFFAGDAVTDTVRKGVLVISEEEMALLSKELYYGFIASMLAAALWITYATRYGLPVSTTHSIVGGIIGIGLFIDPSMIDYAKVGQIVISWIASPLLGGILAYSTFYIIKTMILDAQEPIDRSRWMAPVLALPTFFVLSLALQFKALKYVLPDAWLPSKNCAEGLGFIDSLGACLPIQSLLTALVMGLFCSTILYVILRNYEFEEKGYSGVETIFAWLQVITACYVAFAHGANDRSNAIGPMAAVWQVFKAGSLGPEAEVPLWLVLLGSLGIVVGITTWGYRVMKTIGEKITHITPTRGFAAQFAAATTVLIFSMPFLAIPISTTHTLVGSVVGVGLAGGASSVDFRVFGKIAASWVASIPAAGFGAMILYAIFGTNETRFIISVLIIMSIMSWLLYNSIKSGPKVEIEVGNGG